MARMEAAQLGARKERGWLMRFRQWEASGVLIALIALVLALSLAAPNFLSHVQS